MVIEVRNSPKIYMPALGSLTTPNTEVDSYRSEMSLATIPELIRACSSSSSKVDRSSMMPSASRSMGFRMSGLFGLVNLDKITLMPMIRPSSVITL